MDAKEEGKDRTNNEDEMQSRKDIKERSGKC